MSHSVDFVKLPGRAFTHFRILWLRMLRARQPSRGVFVDFCCQLYENFSLCVHIIYINQKFSKCRQIKLVLRWMPTFPWLLNPCSCWPNGANLSKQACPVWIISSDIFVALLRVTFQFAFAKLLSWNRDLSLRSELIANIRQHLSCSRSRRVIQDSTLPETY